MRFLPIFVFVLLFPLLAHSAPSMRTRRSCFCGRTTRARTGRLLPKSTGASAARTFSPTLKRSWGTLPGKKPHSVVYLGEDRHENFIRKKLTIRPEGYEPIPAYLFLPNKKGGKAPAVLCLHQTNGGLGAKEPAGLGGKANLHYAVHLAERGYVTLAPDYPSFGEYPYDFKKAPFLSGSMKALWNNMIAVDFLVALPEVEPMKIGVIGHSLGGHNAMFTAAFDTRIQAIVSNCGFTSFPKYRNGKIKGWTSDRYMPRIASLYDLDPAKVPFDFPEIVAAFAPRAFLASSPLRDDNFDVSGVKDCLAAAAPVYELLEAKERLDANYPDCAHDFPAEARNRAYEFLYRWLK